MNKPPEPPAELKTLGESPYLRLVTRDRWSFVQRQSSMRVVAIAAVSAAEKLILVEQFRTPTDSRVIELPAGLVGDVPGQENESLQIAAARELQEETGYIASEWSLVATVTSSAGLTDERVAVFLATGLTKTGSGGGDETEDITVHEIPLADVPAWLEDATQRGLDVDARVYGALYWARR